MAEKSLALGGFQQLLAPPPVCTSFALAHSAPLVVAVALGLVEWKQVKTGRLFRHAERKLDALFFFLFTPIIKSTIRALFCLCWVHSKWRAEEKMPPAKLVDGLSIWCKQNQLNQTFWRKFCFSFNLFLPPPAVYRQFSFSYLRVCVGDRGYCTGWLISTKNRRQLKIPRNEVK